jgi:hypothetical protein
LINSVVVLINGAVIPIYGVVSLVHCDVGMIDSAAISVYGVFNRQCCDFEILLCPLNRW